MSMYAENNKIYMQVEDILDDIDERCPTEKTSLRLKKFLNLYGDLERADEILATVTIDSKAEDMRWRRYSNRIDEIFDRLEAAENYSLHRRCPIQSLIGFEWDLGLNMR